MLFQLVLNHRDICLQVVEFLKLIYKLFRNNKIPFRQFLSQKIFSIRHDEFREAFKQQVNNEANRNAKYNGQVKQRHSVKNKKSKAILNTHVPRISDIYTHIVEKESQEQDCRQHQSIKL